MASLLGWLIATTGGLLLTGPACPACALRRVFTDGGTTAGGGCGGAGYSWSDCGDVSVLVTDEAATAKASPLGWTRTAGGGCSTPGVHCGTAVGLTGGGGGGSLIMGAANLCGGGAGAGTGAGTGAGYSLACTAACARALWMRCSMTAAAEDNDVASVATGGAAGDAVFGLGDLRPVMLSSSVVATGPAPC